MSDHVSNGSTYPDMIPRGFGHPDCARVRFIHNCNPWVRTTPTLSTESFHLGEASISSLQMYLCAPSEIPSTTRSKSLPRFNGPVCMLCGPCQSVHHDSRSWLTHFWISAASLIRSHNGSVGHTGI